MGQMLEQTAQIIMARMPEIQILIAEIQAQHLSEIMLHSVQTTMALDGAKITFFDQTAFFRMFNITAISVQHPYY